MLWLSTLGPFITDQEETPPGALPKALCALPVLVAPEVADSLYPIKRVVGSSQVKAIG